MLSWIKGPRPDITPAQIVGLIPIFGNFLSAWGIFTPSPAQIDSLEKMAYAGAALFIADSVVRTGRNIADGLKAKAASK